MLICFRFSLAITLALHLSASVFAYNCQWLLTRISQPHQTKIVERSEISLKFWKSANKANPETFAQWASRSKPEYINGLPTFESRPDSQGFTNWVMAFGRAHRLNPELIAESERQQAQSSWEFKKAFEEFKKNPSDEVENQLALLASKAQYYREMQQALSGDFFPFPEQGREALDRFLDERSGDFRMDLEEAHIRLWQAETLLTETLNHQESSLVETLPLLREINFYKDAISEITARVSLEKASQPAHHSMTRSRLP
jgi:hypothetical protein